MRIAAIDIGTNSVHMIVVQVRPDLSFEVIDREKEMVRLGAGGLDGRRITETANEHRAPLDLHVAAIHVTFHPAARADKQEFLDVGLLGKGA